MSEFYKYKNNVYIMITRCKMKCPETRKWLDAYQYTDGLGSIYVRECRDFEKKFKLIDNKKIRNLAND